MIKQFVFHNMCRLASPLCKLMHAKDGCSLFSLLWFTLFSCLEHQKFLSKYSNPCPDTRVWLNSPFFRYFCPTHYPISVLHFFTDVKLVLFLQGNRNNLSAQAYHSVLGKRIQTWCNHPSKSTSHARRGP